MKSQSTVLILALAISGASAWSCSKSSTPAADDKSAAAPAPAPAAASAAAPVASAAPKVATTAPAIASAAKPAMPALPSAPVVAAKPAASAPTGPDPHADIKTVVPEAIRLLDAKDYLGFFKTMIPPSQIAQAPMPIEQMAAMMSSMPGAADEFGKLSEALKQIKDHAPTMDASGNKATFTLDPPIGDNKEVSFVKENGLWYFNMN